MNKGKVAKYLRTDVVKNEQKITKFSNRQKKPVTKGIEKGVQKEKWYEWKLK